MSTAALALAALTAILATGCERRSESTATSPTNRYRTDDGGAGASASMQATGVDTMSVEKLSSARCDREEACNHLGAGKTYASRDACMYQMRGSMAKELNSSNCPNGVDQNAVERCMAAIRSEECGHPLDTLVRLEKCRALCQ
jgi:hypothetical protein